MALRVVREVLVLVGSTVLVFALVVLVIYGAFASLEFGELLSVVPEFVFGFAGPGLALWAALVAVGAALLRHRGPWWRIGAHALSAFIAGIANVAIVVALGEASDAQGGFVGALGLLGSALFVPLAMLATPIVVLLLDRGRPTAPAPLSTTSDPADAR
ncbi:hypothetical protein [Microcella sp.]|uniref:hypothetical protein n=1 Tax=Microcella sp. TaxID=1913979 RepID=UPI00256E9030|nr:hypothetical protein [Microcella sp.]MBX9471879.1 hypothetical protein [Microcella sp.]